MKAFDTIIKILKEKNQDKRLIKTVAIGFGASIVVILLSFTWLVRQYELKALDLQFRIREWYKPMKVSDDIVLVKIDDETVKELGWPLPRAQYALLIKGLESCKPKALVFDILLADPSREEYSQEDDLLAYMTEQAGNVYHAAVFSTHSDFSSPASDEKQLNKFALPSSRNPSAESLSVNSVITPVPSILEASKGIGNIAAQSDDDGVLRRVPMIVKYHGRFYPSLSLSAVLEFLGVDKVSISPGKEVKLLSEKFGETSIPIDKHGRMLVNYSGKKDAFLSYSFLGLAQRLLEPETSEKLEKRLRDKIVLIGSATTGDVDSKPTPFSSSSSMLTVHANIINDILKKDFLGQAPASMGAILAILLGLLIAAAVAIFRRPAFSIISLAALLFIYAIISQVSFAHVGKWMPLLQPTLAIVFSFLATTSYRYILDKNELIDSLAELCELKGRMQQKNVADEVTRYIRHEIKNAMATIYSSLERILKSDKTIEPASKEKLRVALQMTNKAVGMLEKVRNILLPGELQNQEEVAGTALKTYIEQVPSDLEENNINEIIENILSSESAFFDRFGIRVERNLSQELLKVDVNDQFEGAILNIVKNAIEAMPDGGVLTIGTKVTNGYAQIEIADTGCGIPDENRESIFDLNFTTKGSAGVGLSVTREVIQDLDGSIDFKSQMGEGTTFFIKLPLSNNRISSPLEGGK